MTILIWFIIVFVSLRVIFIFKSIFFALVNKSEIFNAESAL